jgi:ADP-heptose:LPS heptosyltransferase
MRIILSRTDSIGDVVLTLPVAGLLKQSFPGCHITFLGRSYTRPVIELCSHVDAFADIDGLLPRPGEAAGAAVERMKALRADVIIHVFPVAAVCKLAYRAGIPVRIATSRRLYTLFTCNRLVKVPRKHSDLHEAQLNLKLLGPLGIHTPIPLSQIADLYGLHSPGTAHPVSLPQEKRTVILHPRSKGSAREWGPDNFGKLISLLPPGQFNILVTGTAEEGLMMKDFLDANRERITDLTGKLTLPEFISLIASCDALVAASTGPLHLAAALGRKAVGLYAPMRPIFPQRWAPLGKHATYLVLEKPCSDCRKTMDCHCIREIGAEEVVKRVTG